MKPQKQYRVKFEIDEDARFEECNGEARPLTREEYEENYYNDAQGQRVPYERYLEYQGNPKRHRYIGILVEAQCPYCETWKDAGSLWGIDLMDDDVEWRKIRHAMHAQYTADEALALPGYLSDVAREMLAEAGHSPSRRALARERVRHERERAKAAREAAANG